LIPVLLLLILFDVAVRRIAWDWAATKRLAAAMAQRVRDFTTVRKVESRHTLDALRQVRQEGTEQKLKPRETPPATPAPDAAAKFEAKGVEGDITKVVGGATNQPIPSAPKKVQPKGAPGEYTSSLLEAKRRAKEQIRKKEQGEE